MVTSVKRLVSITETRHVLGDIGHTTVYELIKRGEIVKVNIGRRGFVTSESLEAYVDRLSGHGEADPTERVKENLGSRRRVRRKSDVMASITPQEVALDPSSSGIDGEVK
jgi:hypothetical protein